MEALLSDAKRINIRFEKGTSPTALFRGKSGSLGGRCREGREFCAVLVKCVW